MHRAWCALAVAALAACAAAGGSPCKTTLKCSPPTTCIRYDDRDHCKLPCPDMKCTPGEHCIEKINGATSCAKLCIGNGPCGPQQNCYLTILKQTGGAVESCRDKPTADVCTEKIPCKDTRMTCLTRLYTSSPKCLAKTDVCNYVLPYCKEKGQWCAPDSITGVFGCTFVSSCEKGQCPRGYGCKLDPQDKNYGRCVLYGPGGGPATPVKTPAPKTAIPQTAVPKTAVPKTDVPDTPKPVPKPAEATATPVVPPTAPCAGLLCTADKTCRVDAAGAAYCRPTSEPLTQGDVCQPGDECPSGTECQAVPTLVGKEVAEKLDLPPARCVSTNPARYDCAWDQNTPAPWNATHRAWCCEQHHVHCLLEGEREALACAMMLRNGHAVTPFARNVCCEKQGLGCTADLFDCAAPQPWSEPQRVWCCREKDVGCLAPCSSDRMRAMRLPPSDLDYCCRVKGVSCSPAYLLAAQREDRVALRRERPFVMLRVRLFSAGIDVLASPKAVVSWLRLNLVRTSETLRAEPGMLQIRRVGVLKAGGVVPSERLSDWSVYVPRQWNDDAQSDEVERIRACGGPRACARASAFPIPRVLQRRARDAAVLGSDDGAADDGDDDEAASGMYAEFWIQGVDRRAEFSAARDVTGALVEASVGGGVLSRPGILGGSVLPFPDPLTEMSLKDFRRADHHDDDDDDGHHHHGHGGVEWWLVALAFVTFLFCVVAAAGGLVHKELTHRRRVLVCTSTTAVPLMPVALEFQEIPSAVPSDEEAECQFNLV
eukprot:Rhum_TRINITY_DN2133_c0_g1::Rhum_TRINITY_DN2133_c0_g1_i1::g.6034::m.6034